MQNMSLFAILLLRIRQICAERFITHIAIVDIEQPAQKWYGEFFRLAGFRRCGCAIGGAVEVGPRRLCLRLRDAAVEDEGFRDWFVEGGCRRELLEGVAFGEAGEGERGCFRHVGAGFGDGEAEQSAQVERVCVGGVETRSRRSGQEDEKRRVMVRKKVVKLGSDAVSLGKRRSSEHAVVKRVGDSQRSKPGKSEHGVRKVREICGVRKRHRRCSSGRRDDEVFKE